MTAPRRRIGLLGGSFDPVHNAHLALARCARAQLQLDAVWLVPAGNPWQRKPLSAGAQQRLDMVRMAIADDARLDVCDCELRRPGPSYTIDTVRELQAAHPDTEFVLVLGADQLDNLRTWNQWESLLGLVDVAAAAREGHPSSPAPDITAALRRGEHHLHLLHMPVLDISASAIRAALAQGIAPLDALPAPVARYIEHHHLYRPQPPSHGHS